jgi:hypothetical protein
MNRERLNSAIEAISNDDVGTARNLLRAYVTENPRDEKGWFWMSRVAEQASEKRACLRRVLDLRFAGE